MNGRTAGVKRKLTTVFCADACNYGQMMSRDEAGTLERLNRYRSIMERLFASHEGRKVNTWGDAIIAEFASVVEAVRCAVEIQDAIGAENRDLPADRQMWFRIGINLGDVMTDNGDIYGDGVNAASRLESLAEPGGIMVSSSVYEFTHRQLAIGFDFAGERRAKGGETPISAWRVRIGGANETSRQGLGSELPPPGVMPEMPAMPELPKASDALGHAHALFGRFREWFDSQGRRVRFSVTMIGFFLALNLLFGSITTPWFIFPSAPFIAYILLNRRRVGEG